MTDPVAVKKLADLLYTRTSGSVFSDGHTWSVGIGCNLQSCVPSGEGVELRVDLDYGCCCTSSSYIIRPDIGNRNWGGINTPSCTPPDQAMMVEFQINSDTSSTIIIGDCDSGVEDIMLSTGDSVNDQIAECAANAKNHGSFVSCTSNILNMLKQAGIISGKEKGAIQKCAAKANLP